MIPRVSGWFAMIRSVPADGKIHFHNGKSFAGNFYDPIISMNGWIALIINSDYFITMIQQVHYSIWLPMYPDDPGDKNFSHKAKISGNQSKIFLNRMHWLPL